MIAGQSCVLELAARSPVRLLDLRLKASGELGCFHRPDDDRMFGGSPDMSTGSRVERREDRLLVGTKVYQYRVAVASAVEVPLKSGGRRTRRNFVLHVGI